MTQLHNISRGSRGIRLIGNGNVEIRGITEDSREVQRGYLFASLKGTRTDGSKYIADALARGAAAVLASNELEHGTYSVPVILSSEPRRTLAEFSATFFGKPSSQLKVVGVTGTNGKTTTTYLLKQLLEQQGIPTGWIGTVGYAWGPRCLASSHTTPSAIRLQSILAQMKSDRMEAVAMEVSSHALDQYRAEAVDFDVAIFTNLTRDHLDYHGDFASYLRAKMRLFELLNNSGKPQRCAVLNADDPCARDIREIVRTHVLTYGIESRVPSKYPDIVARNVRLTSAGASFDVETPHGRAQLTTRLLGRFNVDNALASLAGGLALGFPLDSVAASLARADAPVGRMEFIATDQPFSLIVDYAHTDDALRNVLSAVREFASGRVLLVFGCGGDRDRGKRPLMGKIAQELATFTYLTSDNPRSEDPLEIIQEIEAGFDRRDAYRVCVDRADAIEQAIAAAMPGDVVLIAGKGHEEVQVLKDGPMPFSDRSIAREILQRMGSMPCRT